MSKFSGEGYLDWDIVADGQGKDKNLGTGHDYGIILDGVPALIYTAFWQQKIDGRFRKATKGVKICSILFDFPDFPPAALMTIEGGDYSVMAVGEPATLACPSDAIVRVRMADAVTFLGGLGPILKGFLTGKVKLKGLGKLWLLVKVLMTKEVE